MIARILDTRNAEAAVVQIAILDAIENRRQEKISQLLLELLEKLRTMKAEREDGTRIQIHLAGTPEAHYPIGGSLSQYLLINLPSSHAGLQKLQQNWNESTSDGLLLSSWQEDWTKLTIHDRRP
jgi:hypothetical protein